MNKLNLEARFREMVGVFHEIYASDAGKKALGMIREESLFDKPTGLQPHEQYAYLAGKRDLFLWIKDLCEMSEEDVQTKIENLNRNLVQF